ncbi:MAG: glutaredoxin family protein [Rubrivivax sp.]
MNAYRLRTCLLVAAWVCAPALAQYKVVQPDGRVLYTDRPPVSSDARVTPLGTPAAALPREVGLPPALRRTSERWPVTLYAAPDCAPCDSARQWLQQRGVPYSERLVGNNDDILALERLSGARTLPALNIGSQALRGFSAAEWDSYIDVAGYPRESALPAGWQPPPPRPLVARVQAAVRPTDSARAPATAPREPPPAAVQEAASGGLRF